MDQKLIGLFKRKLLEAGLIVPQWCVLRFVANCLLVLKGGRLSYLVFKKDKAESVMFEAILKRKSCLTDIHFSKNRSLLVLRENADKVMEMFDEAGSGHVAFAKVLGYRYQGRGWSKGDRYAVTYHFRYQGVKSHLYTFMVPVAAYNDACRAQIAEDVIRFNSCLAMYGFEIRWESKFSPAI